MVHMSIAAEGMTATDLVERLRSGDTSAGSVLYERHFAMAVRLARRSGHPHDAEETASEAFARVFAAIRKGRGPTEAFSLYLRSGLRNGAMALFRHRARVRTLDDIERVVVGHIPDHADDGHDTTRHRPCRGVRRTPAKVPLVLRARVLEGRSNRESASALGMTATAEAMLYMRARRALKKSHLDTESGRMRMAIAAFRKRHASL